MRPHPHAILSTLVFVPLLSWAVTCSAQTSPTSTPTGTPRLNVTARLTQVSGHSVIACSVKDGSGKAVPSQIVSVQKAAAITGPFALWMSKNTTQRGVALFPYARPKNTWYVRCYAGGSVSSVKMIKGQNPGPSPTVTPTKAPIPTGTASPPATATPTPVSTLYVEPPIPTAMHSITLGPTDDVQAAIDSAQPGDQIVLLAGNYHQSLTLDSSGTSQNPIQLISKGVFDGATVSGTGKWWYIRGVRVRNNRNGLQIGALRIGTHWTVVNSTVEYNTGRGISLEGDSIVAYNLIARFNCHEGFGGQPTNSVLILGETHDNNRGCVNPPWKDDPHAKFIDGLYYVDSDWEGGGGKFTEVNNFTIDGLKAYQNGGPGVWFDISNRNYTVRNVQAHNNVGVTYDGQGVGIVAGEVSYGPATIVHNHVWGNKGAGIAVAETENVTITDNDFENSLELRNFLPRDSFKLLNILVQDNRFYGSADQHEDDGGTPLDADYRRTNNIVTEPNQYNLPLPVAWSPRGF